MVIMGITIALIQTYQNRTSAIGYSLKKADALAEVVQSGLTAHMINNTIDKRKAFLDSIANTKTIENIWIVRGDSVEKQFGKSSLSLDVPHDQLDKQVLQTGQTSYKVIEDFSNAKLRVTIPYKAIATNKINCLECHQVKHNETLGAVSIVMDITDFKSESIAKLIGIFFIIIISIVLLILTINKMLHPYLQTLDALQRKLKYASNGEFKEIQSIKNENKDELEQLVNNYNTLIGSLVKTFQEIEVKLKGFVGKTITKESINPLHEATDILANLSLLYQFKKQLQLDKDRDEIYQRLGSIFNKHFKFKHLNIYEFDSEKYTIVYKHGEFNFCNDAIMINCNECRAYRNGANITSSEHHQNCPSFSSEDHYYFCIEKKISKSSVLVFNFVFENKRSLEIFKENLPIIENYIAEAKPEIEMRLLLQALEDASLKDGLTGLHNRRYFDTYVQQLISQSRRQNIKLSALMVDIDHFKAVNDEYGHDIGDKVLTQTAHIIKDNVRESDIVVRFGGEEFVVILVGIENEDNIFEIAEKLRNKIAENEIDVYAGSTIKKTASFGFSIFPDDSTSFTTVMKYADLALYDAKETGRNQVIRYKENKDDDLVLF
jgi:diguanylate cyclase (GGDEF)-like protein